MPYIGTPWVLSNRLYMRVANTRLSSSFRGRKQAVLALLRHF